MTWLTLRKLLVICRSVRLKLQRGEATMSAEQYDSATVYFSDVSDFAEISDRHSPMQIVTILNEIYRLVNSTNIALLDSPRMRRQLVINMAGVIIFF